MGNFLGGSDPSLTYAQSPQQQQLFNMAMPTMQNMYTSGAQYQIPNAVAPTQDWYNSISPEVKAGMMAPYTDMSNQLTESLGYSGGSARGGASGMLGAAQGRFWSDAGKDYGMNLWNMTSPGLMNNWSAQLQQNMMPYTMAPNFINSSLPTPVVNPGKTGFFEGALTTAGNLGMMYGVNKLFGN